MAKSGKAADIPLETFSKVVEEIYDCALDPNRWQNTLCMIAEACRSQWCALGVHDYVRGGDELMFRLGYPEDFWRLHEGKYKGMNPYFGPLQLLPVGAVATSAMLVSDHEFFETRFYRELVKPWGVQDTIGVKVLQTGQRIGSLAANRIKPRPRYGDAEVRLFTLCSPHICRAVTISDVLNLNTVKSEALEATLNALAAGVYLTDHHGRIVFMNSAAERQVKTSNALRIENNRLAPVDRTARAAMSQAIADAIADEAATPASGVTLALPGDEQSGFVATILPLTRGERQSVCGAFAATAAIFVQDPVVVPPFPGEAFAKLYGMTGSELRVLLAMAPGLGVKEAAELLGIGETTAKTHLQHIYAKTGTSKQTELMHLFMSSTPPVKAA
jgi:DNA-binding CsgD family transcriptional regulator/PAS domain-containing protein